MSVAEAPPAVEPRSRLWTAAEFDRMADLGLIDRGRVTLAGGGLVGPDGDRYRLTRDDLIALTDHRFFAGQRAMLIDGEVLVMAAMKQPHITGIVLVLDALRPAFGAGYHFRPQAPLDLGLYIDPEPDVAVIAGSPRSVIAVPRTAVLVVEVSDTTLAYDLTTKAELYATAGIADYWVLDEVGGGLHVLRDPAPVGAGGHAYRSQRTLGPADTLAPLAAPAAAVAVVDLLP